MHLFGAMTFDDEGKIAWDYDLLETLGLAKPGTGTTTTFGVYDADGKLISPAYSTEAEANTWKFNHPELEGLSVRTAGTTTTSGTTAGTTTGTTTGTTAGTTTTDEITSTTGEPKNSLHVADKIGELTGAKTSLLSSDGTIPFLTENGNIDYTTALAYVKVDDADKKQFAATEIPEANKTVIENLFNGKTPDFTNNTIVNGRHEGTEEVYSWFSDNVGKYININGKYYIITSPSHIGSQGSLFWGTDPQDTINFYSLDDGKTKSYTYTVGSNEMRF
jgi:hypothetical protein